jgi:hypothetical protein
MLISGWRRFYDEGDGGSADEGAASAGSQEGGDLVSGTDGADSGGGSDLSDAGAGGGPSSGAGGAGANTDAGGNGVAAGSVAPTLFDRFRSQLGVDFSSKYKSEEELLRGLTEAYRLNGRLGQEAAIGRRYAGYETQFEQFLRQQQAATQQQQQVEQEKPWWSPPQLPAGWEEWVTRDAEGNRVFKEDTPLAIRQAVEEHATYHRGWQEKLLRNPVEALQGPLEQFRQQIRQEIFGELQSQQYQQQTNQAAQSFVQQNADWIYAKTDGGQWVTDDQGRPVLTQAGGVLASNIVKLQQAGVQDGRALQEMAMEMTRAQLMAQHNGTAGAAIATVAPGMPATQAARTSPAPVHTGMTRGRQPTGGTVPGQPKNNPGTRGLSLREKMERAAGDVPANEFAET